MVAVNVIPAPDSVVKAFTRVGKVNEPLETVRPLANPVTVVVCQLPVNVPLVKDRPEPMLEHVPAVHGFVYVKLPLETDRPDPRPVTVVVCHPWFAVVSKVPEVGNVSDVAALKVKVHVYAPENVTAPPKVRVLEDADCATPVPPYNGLNVPALMSLAEV